MEQKDTAALAGFWEYNSKRIFSYIFLAMVLYVLLISGLFFFGRIRVGMLLIGLPLVLLIVTQPKLAVGQFLFALFINLPMITSPVVLYLDISAVLLCLAALFDFFLRPNEKLGSTVFLKYYIALLVVLVISAVFSFNPALAVNPFIRQLFLVVTFLSLTRLVKYFELMTVIRIFYYFCLLHSIVAIVPYIGGSFTERVFGFSKSTLDDFLMFSLPIGFIFLLTERGYKTLLHILSFGIMFLALLATQSRLPLLFVVASFAGILLVLRKSIDTTINMAGVQSFLIQIKRRAKYIIMLGIAGLIMFLLLFPGLFEAVDDRFRSLLTLEKGDTLYIRLVMWKAAIKSFLDHPIVGIGPGQFRALQEIYNEMHFSYVYIFVKGLSAHNLLLHYLAEYGLLGASVLLAFFIKIFRVSHFCWKHHDRDSFKEALIIFLFGTLLLVTVIVEAGWMWGQMSYLLAFLTAIIARQYLLTRQKM